MAAAASAQQAAAAAAGGAKAQPISIDPLPLGGVTGPSGPAQLTPTARPLPALPTPRPPPASPTEQVAVNIAKAIGAGADKINIRLHPATLGRVEVSLEIAKDGLLTATVTADRPETLELLQRDARGLERALQDAGLRTNSDSLNFSLREQGKQAAGNHGNGPQNEHGDDADNPNQNEYGPNAGTGDPNHQNDHRILSDGRVNMLV